MYVTYDGRYETLNWFQKSITNTIFQSSSDLDKISSPAENWKLFIDSSLVENVLMSIVISKMHIEPEGWCNLFINQ